ncbi:MAG TPA: 2-oxo-4-hydroxy-4-carboxy-5-ureidoimidazoline decarboxylase [Terriglobales bacterium]|nr:2-oxo-4-hydroxy-4-carboxy-5-ureidoimidazoline decarboxylase [Terriglobales bacterium]
MRSDPAEYELVVPGSLQAVVSLLETQPGEWLPIAGGTDIMVQYAAGKLGARKLVSLWNLPELRRIEASPGEVSIGAGCTYTEVQEHEVVAREFPLLVSAARWTGGIANQNRGTLGGNIVNASPAADSLPALLVYEAELVLVSARGERRVRYVDFHSGYKTTLLAPGELIRAVCLARRFRGYVSYARKVGARRAQAIAKVAMAALGRMASGVVEDVRMAVGSVAPVPLRLWETERCVRGQVNDAALVSHARQAAVQEIRPIDDIRSMASYRSAVVANLVAEFLFRLRRERGSPESEVLVRWNQRPAEEAARDIEACCGSSAWARELALRRPFPTEASLRAAADEIWNHLGRDDWMEAFSKHPRIGEKKSSPAASAQSRAWSAEEQQDAGAAGEELVRALRDANQEYEARFGRVFIVCATGKSASEILEILRRRLRNDDGTELRQAAEEQRKITEVRLQKWLWG